MDFDTTPLTATFAIGVTMSNVSVPVISDDVVEGLEEFDLLLTVPPSLAPAITAGGRDRAIGVITDSTSKCMTAICTYVLHSYYQHIHTYS